MIVQPKARGFICTTAHPDGCAANVAKQINHVKKQGALAAGPKRVLVIGASTGYGLASRIAAAFAAQAETIGVFFEKPATEKRTATAGWYNTVAFEKAAAKAGLYAKSINGDAFSDAIKTQTIELIQKDWGGEVDLVIYSLAAPRRKDPKTGEVYSSTLKPMGETFTSKTVDLNNYQVETVSIEPANDEDVAQTVKVMGGEDWQLWLQALLQAGVLAKGVKTLAYSYIGPQLTHAIYREGTIGAAKKHLEQTAASLTTLLAPVDGEAFVSVNKALVTQAAAAIPVVPLYSSILYNVMKAKGLHEGCIEQMDRLFREKLYGSQAVITDETGMIRMDDWEMKPEVQEAAWQAWQAVNSDNLRDFADIDDYRQEFLRLFGFEMPGVDYSQDIDIQCAIPSIKNEGKS
jgi:enoyl-[acyl-carrier protein] reductase/trans-2-enoyl-CoA reductase (NAD+)